MSTQVAIRTRQFIVDNFLYMRPDFVVGDDDHLIERGIVDSMGMAEMVAFVQDEFGIAVADEDITEANFATINRVSRYIAARGVGSETAAA